MTVISLFRRAAWTFLVICLAGSVAADSYHPDILKSQVVTLDAGAIERNAQSSTPFDLVLGDVHFTLVLAPAPLFPKGGLPVFEVFKGGVTKRIVGAEITYAGDVVGEDPKSTEARFAISRGVLDGYVLSSAGWYFIEPLSRFDAKAGRDQYLVYATRDLDFALPYGDDGVILDTVIDWTTADDGRIPVAMVADSIYISLSGESFTFDERQAALLNKVNGIYHDQTGRDFKMQAAVGDNAGLHLTSTDAPTLLDKIWPFLQIFGGLSALQSEVAHLTTAKNLDGNTLGIAFIGGRTGLSQQAVVFAGGGGGGGGTAARLSFQNMMVAAHELGHNFNGEHGEADKWCVTSVLICLDYERTIMWPTFFDDNNARFSDGTRDPNHNNRRRIRDNMALRGF
ncbi:MAG: M12 family metallo-peptidase [Acidobacteriota bacterium]